MSVTPDAPQTNAPATRQRPPARRLALAIVGGILAVLGVGALAEILAVAPLRPPTQADASQRAGLYTLTLTIAPEPLTAGQATTFTLRVTDVSGAPVANAHLTCDFTMPAMPMPTMLVSTRASGGGDYTCGETLPDPGSWALTITLTPPGATPVHTTFSMQAR